MNSISSRLEVVFLVPSTVKLRTLALDSSIFSLLLLYDFVTDRIDLHAEWHPTVFLGP